MKSECGTQRVSRKFPSASGPQWPAVSLGQLLEPSSRRLAAGTASQVPAPRLLSAPPRPPRPSAHSPDLVRGFRVHLDALPKHHRQHPGPHLRCRGALGRRRGLRERGGWPGLRGPWAQEPQPPTPSSPGSVSGQLRGVHHKPAQCPAGHPPEPAPHPQPAPWSPNISGRGLGMAPHDSPGHTKPWSRRRATRSTGGQCLVTQHAHPTRHHPARTEEHAGQSRRKTQSCPCRRPRSSHA